jgi:IS5 family transposase
VEHVLAAITQWGGKRIRTIGQTRATFAMGMMVVVLCLGTSPCGSVPFG